jgi:ribosome maturation factor RimP
MTDLDAVITAVAPVIEALGLELYDVELSGTGRARVLRVMIDRPAGPDGARPGIDLEAIAAATEAVSPLLDAPPLDRIISGSYSLELSSPGLERPLRTAAHFARAVGETVSVKTRTANMPARRVRGRVEAAADESCTLLADDGTEHTISYAEVVQARTVFEWGNETGPSRSRRAAAKGAKPGAGGRKKEVVRR